jgi:prevent-host-death family protein
MMKTITMGQFRAGPGEFLHEVSKHGKSFLITHAGKPAAKLVPVDDAIIVERDGEIRGELPLSLGVRRKGGY